MSAAADSKNDGHRIQGAEPPFSSLMAAIKIIKPNNTRGGVINSIIILKVEFKCLFNPIGLSVSAAANSENDGH